MSLPPDQSQSRKRGRLWVGVALVFILQLTLIFLLADRSSVKIRSPHYASAMHLISARPQELLALEDPTWFVLPHERGFSGEGWMKMQGRRFESWEWSETNIWLELSGEQLGSEFARFIQTNLAPAIQFPSLPKPALTLPAIGTTFPASTLPALRLEGDLANRRLLSHPELSSKPDASTNSVVQLLVDGRGYTFSAVLMPPGSGDKTADEMALKIARSARFEPTEPAGPDRPLKSKMPLTLGTMIFEWQILPPTNGVPLTQAEP